MATNGIDRVHKHEIRVPACVSLASKLLTVQVMTIRNVDWKPLIGPNVRSSIGYLRADRSRDAILDALESPNLAEPVDFSVKAKQLLKRQKVDTFSGTYLRGDGATPRATTKHTTLGAKERAGLREALPDDFDELLNSATILDCEIQFGGDDGDIKKGTKLRLRPLSGEIILTRKADDASLAACLKKLIPRP